MKQIALRSATLNSMIHRDVHFKPLQAADFALLLKWLETPHVKAEWDQAISWTPELIHEKYSNYVEGYKIAGGKKKPIHAFLIYTGQTPVGYIQHYNAYDFERGRPLHTLPESLAALDFYIGEPAFLRQGIGALALKKYLREKISPHFAACLVDPDLHNVAARRCYEKAGFVPVEASTTDVRLLWQ